MVVLRYSKHALLGPICSQIIFAEGFPSYLSLHYETLFFVNDFLKIHMFK